GKLDLEEEPARYAGFLARLLEKAFRLEDDSATRLRLCNEIIERIAGAPTASFLIGNRLVAAAKSVLLEITPPQNAEGTIPRPETPLTESSLFTGSPSDPQLGPVNTNSQSFDDESKDDKSGEEDIQFVEAAKNAAISFEPAEKPFDFIAPAVGLAIVFPRLPPVRIGWDYWHIA